MTARRKTASKAATKRKTTARKARTRTVKKSAARKKATAAIKPAARKKSAAPKRTAARKPAPTSTHLSLSGKLDIDAAGKLHTRLRKCADKHLDVNINAADVDLADTAGLQLLLAFVTSVSGNGKNIDWQAVSPALQSAAGKAGIDGLLGLDTAA